MEIWQIAAIAVGTLVFLVLLWKAWAGSRRDRKNTARALKMVPMLIHLPPSTDDIEVGGRDERDVINEQLSEAQVMYSIISSTLKKGLKAKLYGQKHISFEIVAHEGFIKYYAIVPAVLTETVKQAIAAAYPTARMEEVADPNFFSAEGKIDAVVGGEMRLKEEYWYPISTYEDSKRDVALGLINAMSVAKKGDGIGLQIMFRPTDGSWVQKSLERVRNIKDGKKWRNNTGNLINRAAYNMGNFVGDVAQALWEPPSEHEKYENEEKQLTNLQQEEIQKIEEKTKYPGFEVLIRIVASSTNKARSETLLSGIVSIFSQFDLPQYNGFRYDIQNRAEDLVRDYVLRIFPSTSKSMILNSVEMASLFHLPSQNSIPTSQVERQAVKQVDGPAKLAEEGIILGVNEFRGEKKVIRLREKDRRRHTYAIGATGSGKSVLLENIAYQDMCDGRGFCFIDPHGDAVEWLLSRVPQERMDDVILFEPGNMDNPVGMNMFEFQSEDQKDFIVQEGINMLTSLYDPGNQGIFGPRAQHMFRNAALLLMSDPAGGTFIDIPRCFIDPEFVKSKLKYVTDKTVYDYWTKEFPASQKSNDAGEVTSWFVSKWGPFLSNKMMRNILGQTESGFNIREIMDNKKILLVNLSKGKTGELNAKLLGMIFVMKFQAAAMSRQDTPEDERVDFCLFVDEFQNFATESFESILSEARKYRLNLILANQFMTQLTDKIREALLGNVGTLMSGRIGVTDAELMEKAFSPVFNAEDLHKQPNYNWIATVMMFDTPTSPFTLKSLPPMGEGSDELMRRMKAYALSKYGRPRAEVEAEIDARLAATNESNAEKEKAPMGGAGLPGDMGAAANIPKPAPKKKNFLDSWLEKKAALSKKSREDATKAMEANETAKPDKGKFGRKNTLFSSEQKPQPTPSTAPEVPKAIEQPSDLSMPPIAPASQDTGFAPGGQIVTQKSASEPVRVERKPIPTPAAAVPTPVPAEEKQNERARKIEAAEELAEMSTGSAWTTVATENAAGTTAKENKRETEELMKADAKMKVQHEPRVLNVRQQAVVAPISNAKVAPAAKPESTQSTAAPTAKVEPVMNVKRANQSDSKAVQDDEDGVVLRWR